MKEASERDFYVTPSQYEPFRFWVERPATLNVTLIATAPVNLVLMDSEQKVEYEAGTKTTHPYTASWPRKRDLDAAVKVEPGTWYLVVEGSTEPSRGRIKVAVNS